MVIILILAVSWAFTKKIFDHRERMEYAKQGLPPPSAGTGSAPAGKPVKAGKPAKTGNGGRSHVPANAPFRDYASTLWADLWDDAKKRHARERAAKRPDGGRRVRDVARGWWNWAKNGGSDQRRNSATPAAPGPATPGPVAPGPATPGPAAPGPATPGAAAPGPNAAPGTPTPPPAPAGTSNARYCPDCGEQLIEHPDGWWHRGRGPCPTTGYAGAWSATKKPNSVIREQPGRPAHPGNAVPPQRTGNQPANPAAPEPVAQPTPTQAAINEPVDPAAAPVVSPEQTTAPAAESAAAQPPPEADKPVRKCTACGEVLVGISLDGHVCPNDPQNRNPQTEPYDPAAERNQQIADVVAQAATPARPYTDPLLEFADDDADPTDSPEEQARIAAAHRSGTFCGDPACGSCANAGRIPEDQRYSRENADAMARDAKHMAGYSCGTRGCEYGCRTCGLCQAGTGGTTDSAGNCRACSNNLATEQARRTDLHAAGKMCGQSGCGCACTVCHIRPAEASGVCQECDMKRIEEQVWRDMFGENCITCPNCGTYQTRYLADTDTPGWVCTACGTVTSGDEPAWPSRTNAQQEEGNDASDEQDATVTATTSAPGAAGPNSTTHNSTTDHGGKTMEFNYDAIVTAHQNMLTDLNSRLEQATEVRDNAAKAKAASDGMDNARAQLQSTANTLVDAMGEAKFDVTSVEGCVTAAEAFSADDAGLVEEKTGELETLANNVITATNAAIEAVQGSLNHIVSTYGGLAEGVQSTGVRGEALEAA